MDEADDIKLMDRLLPDNAENMAALLEHNIQDDTFTNGTIRSDDLQYRNLDVINLIEPFNVIEYVKEEVVECEEEVDLNSYSIAASNSGKLMVTYFIRIHYTSAPTANCTTTDIISDARKKMFTKAGVKSWLSHI